MNIDASHKYIGIPALYLITPIHADACIACLAGMWIFLFKQEFLFVCLPNLAISLIFSLFWVNLAMFLVFLLRFILMPGLDIWNLILKMLSLPYASLNIDTQRVNKQATSIYRHAIDWREHCMLILGGKTMYSRFHLKIYQWKVLSAVGDI